MTQMYVAKVGHCGLCSRQLPPDREVFHADCESALRQVKSIMRSRHANKEPDTIVDFFRCMKTDLAILMSFPSGEIRKAIGQEAVDFIVDTNIKLGGIRCL